MKLVLFNVFINNYEEQIEIIYFENGNNKNENNIQHFCEKVTQ